MKAVIGSQLLSSAILLLRIVSVCTDVFLVRPGDGEEFVYSPIDVNATIHCVVNHTNVLLWTIDGFSLESENLRPVINSRGIFQTGITNSSGIIESNVTVLGNKEMNNNTRICCQSVMNAKLEESCTTLRLYGNLNNMPSHDPVRNLVHVMHVYLNMPVT